ncbi:uncharacterized protein EV420DRAFT_1476738 [Desarmillaria tabescens]|uniref:Uncharacterized protein n=1 Tax=Armillaria tabescens TaxID=1929756 RepID=A0AA39NCH3_ARMTA|nr:uncharacterized protein EV420DRAFT_1476738 [Desarmillaria tabescens]KAK0462968.1 hypothetical protein EV420DRAFT_1476738 [Desarmillaria tabescens]
MTPRMQTLMIVTVLTILILNVSRLTWNRVRIVFILGHTAPASKVTGAGQCEQETVTPGNRTKIADLAISINYFTIRTFLFCMARYRILDMFTSQWFPESRTLWGDGCIGFIQRLMVQRVGSTRTCILERKQPPAALLITPRDDPESEGVENMRISSKAQLKDSRVSIVKTAQEAQILVLVISGSLTVKDDFPLPARINDAFPVGWEND